MLKPPTPYAGGKQAIAQQIVDLMPEHKHYVEPFAGALSVLLAKPPSMIETVNDLDGDIVAFWRVLRDRPGELERMCALTPHSRQQYEECRDHVDGEDDLAKAWRTWVFLTQAIGSRPSRCPGWKRTQGGGRHNLARYLDGYLARIAPAAERLRQVSVEHRPALDVIRRLDGPDTLFYCDPPYLATTRLAGIYRHEMGDEASHEELLDVLTSCRGKVMLSGYRNGLYDDMLADWRRVDIPTTCMTGQPRTESIWTNYQPDNFDGIQNKLFDTATIGDRL